MIIRELRRRLHRNTMIGVAAFLTMGAVGLAQEVKPTPKDALAQTGKQPAKAMLDEYEHVYRATAKANPEAVNRDFYAKWYTRLKQCPIEHEADAAVRRAYYERLFLLARLTEQVPEAVEHARQALALAESDWERAKWRLALAEALCGRLYVEDAGAAERAAGWAEIEQLYREARPVFMDLDAPQWTTETWKALNNYMSATAGLRQAMRRGGASPAEIAQLYANQRALLDVAEARGAANPYIDIARFIRQAEVAELQALAKAGLTDEAIKVVLRLPRARDEETTRAEQFGIVVSEGGVDREERIQRLRWWLRTQPEQDRTDALWYGLAFNLNYVGGAEECEEAAAILARTLGIDDDGHWVNGAPKAKDQPRSADLAAALSLGIEVFRKVHDRARERACFALLEAECPKDELTVQWRARYAMEKLESEAESGEMFDGKRQAGGK